MTNQAFTSLGGLEPDGTRTEVHVEVGTGIVKSVNTDDSDVTARVSFKNPVLEHPSIGWIRQDDPLFQKLLDAKASKAEVSYRIEGQRKKKIAKNIPMSELRKDMETAAKSLSRILVGVDGEYTNEALTNPAEDPAPGGRVSALTNPVSTSPAPATETRPVSRAAVREEPAWADYNSDGSPNLGSAIVATVIGADIFVRKHLVANDKLNPSDYGKEDVEKNIHALVEAILTTADALQISIHNGRLPKANRGVNSHTRVRTVLYDTIDSGWSLPDPTDAETVRTWKNDVYTTVLARLRAIMAVAYPDFYVKMYPQTKIQAEKLADKPATLSSVEGLKELVKAAGLTEELNAVTGLILWTFGVKKAAEIDDDSLKDFVNFYASAPETFAAAARFAVKELAGSN